MSTSHIALQPTTFAGIALPNCIGRSAVAMAMSNPDGTPTDYLIGKYAALARGKVGLIIVEHSFVHPRGRADPAQLGIHSDAVVPGHKALIQAVKQANPDCKIVLQIAHAGAFAMPSENEGPAKGPSRPEQVGRPAYPAAASTFELDEIKSEIIDPFVAAAVRAQKAGYDGVQLHFAHGYCVAEFLSPVTNKREDRYGADRGLLAEEITRAVRESIDLPLLAKVGADHMEGGTTAADIGALLIRLAAAGLDGAEISGGNFLAPPMGSTIRGKKYFIPAYNAADHTTIRAAIDEAGLKDFDTGLVGGFRALNEIDDALNGDFPPKVVLLARAFICEPDLVARWIAGNDDPAICKSCNGCIIRLIKGKTTECVFNAA